MLRKLLQDKRFKSDVEKFYEKNKAIIDDIVIFGSASREKEEASDIDVLIILKAESPGIEKICRDMFQDEKFHVIVKLRQELESPAFIPREGYLFEGYSLIKNQSIANNYGYEAMYMFVYSTKNLPNSKRTKFYYAMNGRGDKGFAENANLLKVSDGVLMAPINEKENVVEFLRHWDIAARDYEILIPKRKKETLFGSLKNKIASPSQKEKNEFWMDKNRPK